jgi:alanine dehydrogenase
VIHDVVHYAVGNMPGAVPHTSTYGLTNATLPYLVDIATRPLANVAPDSALASGFNTVNGHVTHETVAWDVGSPFVTIADAI